MGIWNVIQILGNKVCEEGAELTEEYIKRGCKRKKDVPVLFEIADGVYIKLQGKDRKKEKQDKTEIKIGIAYDRWRRGSLKFLFIWEKYSLIRIRYV